MNLLEELAIKRKNQEQTVTTFLDYLADEMSKETLAVLYWKALDDEYRDIDYVIEQHNDNINYFKNLQQIKDKTPTYN